MNYTQAAALLIFGNKITHTEWEITEYIRIGTYGNLVDENELEITLELEALECLDTIGEWSVVE